MGVLMRVNSRQLRSIKSALQILNLNFGKCHNDGPPKSVDELKEPTTCCMSGCANCVWIEYAEKLCQLYQDGGEEAIKRINEKVTDPNMKAFLLHEMRMKKPK